jgi:uncharacterized membrane protein
MDDLTVARTIHVIAVVLWIGGVAFVTTVLLPAVRQAADPANRVQRFEELERRFAWQARVTTVLTGASGFYMLYVLDAWDRYLDPSFWWVHAMTAIWAVFTLMLFVLEPLLLHDWFNDRVRRAPEETFSLIQTLHRVLLLASLVTIAGAMVGAHGG